MMHSRQARQSPVSICKVIELVLIVLIIIIVQKGNGAKLMKPDVKRRRTKDQLAADRKKEAEDKEILKRARTEQDRIEKLELQIAEMQEQQINQLSLFKKLKDNKIVQLIEDGELEGIEGGPLEGQLLE